MRIASPEGKETHEIELPSIGTATGLSGSWESGEVFYGFASFAFPSAIYRSDLTSGKQEVWFQTRTPIDTKAIEAKQVWFASKDGTRVPIFVLAKKGLALNGKNPTLLLGYGGFNISMTPRFNATFAAWVSRGGVTAIPSLRGGGEFCEAWHVAGMQANKQKVFDDFIGAARVADR